MLRIIFMLTALLTCFKGKTGSADKVLQSEKEYYLGNNGSGKVFAGPQKQGKLILNINGFRNTGGTLHINVFDKADGFPGEHKKAAFSRTVAVNDTLMQIELPEFEYGTYAVAVHHDENADGKVNTNWLGIPHEGIGTSNNVQPGFGPPDFEDTRFKVEERVKKLSIEIIYL